MSHISSHPTKTTTTILILKKPCCTLRWHGHGFSISAWSNARATHPRCLPRLPWKGLVKYNKQNKQSIYFYLTSCLSVDVNNHSPAISNGTTSQDGIHCYQPSAGCHNAQTKLIHSNNITWFFSFSYSSAAWPWQKLAKNAPPPYWPWRCPPCHPQLAILRPTLT